MRRISERMWKPGELIPGEVELAAEFGCARATVNRALRQLAEAGLLDRRRKGGTRVARYPVRKATLDIPITRLEVEKRGASYSHKILSRKLAAPSALLRRQMNVDTKSKLLHIPALHFANGIPFLFEDRWVNLQAAPALEQQSFSNINANEWLIENAPFSNGDIRFSAANATSAEAEYLKCREGEALFVIDRTTWNLAQSVTSVRLAYAPGYHISSHI